MTKKMTSNDKDRVNIFRRIIDSSDEASILKDFLHSSDEDLLLLLNSTVLPNSISLNSLKFSILNNLIISDSEKRKRVKTTLEKISSVFKIMSKSEKDMLKYGIFYGYDSFNWKYQLYKYSNHSSSPDGGDLYKRKTISSYMFERAFPFIYRIVSGGESNESFPRV